MFTNDYKHVKKRMLPILTASCKIDLKIVDIFHMFHMLPSLALMTYSEIEYEHAGIENRRGENCITLH